uniref:N-acetyltransferase domain-containing protein n=2 Tax=Stomoxys calcitrans TaxID=35570 RepID=A0A1I8P225_STOCA
MKQLQILKNIEDLKLLRDLYKKESLATRHGYYTLTNFINWFELNPHLDFVKVYVVSSTWRESGFYIIEDQYQLFINCVVYNEEEITMGINSMDWKRAYKITALPAILMDIVEKTLQGLPVKYRHTTLWTYEQDREAIQLNTTQCPEGFEVRPLSVSDAATVNNLWYSRQDGSLDFLESVITYNISLGVYRKDTNELIAWCTRCPCGFLGTLHVREEHRRHGLASLLINEFSQRLAKEGECVRVMINEMNRTSMNLFTKFGFRLHEKVFILFCEPRNI